MHTPQTKNKRGKTTMTTEKEIRARRLALLGHLPEVLKMCDGRFLCVARHTGKKSRFARCSPRGNPSATQASQGKTPPIFCGN